MSKQPTPAIAAMLQELDLSRQIMKMIFDNISSAIVLVAPDTRIIFVNQYAINGSIRVREKPMEVGDSILDYKLPGDATHEKFKENFTRALTSRAAVIYESELSQWSQGWIRTEYIPVFDGDNTVGVMLHFHNITERKVMENRNEQQTSILNQIAWSQSHETRQPLATLLGLINILDKDSLTDENKKIIALLESTARKLEDVIRKNVLWANTGATSDDNAHRAPDIS